MPRKFANKGNPCYGQNGMEIFGRPAFLHFFDHQTLEIHEIHETGHFGFQLFNEKFIYLG